MLFRYSAHLYSYVFLNLFESPLFLASFYLWNHLYCKKLLRIEPFRMAYISGNLWIHHNINSLFLSMSYNCYILELICGYFLSFWIGYKPNLQVPFSMMVRRNVVTLRSSFFQSDATEKNKHSIFCLHRIRLSVHTQCNKWNCYKITLKLCWRITIKCTIQIQINRQNITKHRKENLILQILQIFVI